MSDDIMQDVWHYSRAKPTTKLVLLCVADNASNVNRQALIDPRDIAERCNCTSRHVYDQLYKLEEMREIQKVADRTYTVREYVATDGMLKGQQLNVFDDHAPQPGNIKDPERRAAIRAKRPRQRRRRT